MKITIRQNAVQNIYAFSVAFLFCGFYTYLVLANSVNIIPTGGGYSAVIRVLFIAACFACLLNLKYMKIEIFGVIYFLFLLFFLYKLAFFFALGEISYGKSHSTLLAYFILYVFLSFHLVYFARFNNQFLNLLNKYLYFFVLIFCMLVTIFFSEYVGHVSRLSTTHVDDESVVSPLILSYNSSILLGFTISLILNTPKTLKVYSLIIFSFVVGGITFALGSSRGAIVALIFSIFILTLVMLKKRTAFRLTSSVVIIVIIFGSLVNYLNKSVFNRFTSLAQSISEGSGSSEVRFLMWKNALSVFSDNVLFGGGFSLERFSTHPHNIYFEVLMSSGIIGFLFFIIPLLSVFYFLFLFTRRDNQWAFLLVLYSQNIAASFFSTSIVTAAWLSLSIGLVLSQLKLTKNH